ncbi:MAG: hypothetical protein WD598_12900 [Acidimicrobiia bacterium]
MDLRQALTDHRNQAEAATPLRDIMNAVRAGSPPAYGSGDRLIPDVEIFGGMLVMYEALWDAVLRLSDEIDTLRDEIRK